MQGHTQLRDQIYLSSIAGSRLCEYLRSCNVFDASYAIDAVFHVEIREHSDSFDASELKAQQSCRRKQTALLHLLEASGG